MTTATAIIFYGLGSRWQGMGPFRDNNPVSQYSKAWRVEKYLEESPFHLGLTLPFQTGQSGTLFTEKMREKKP